MASMRAVISDFGGVLTTPLMHSFAAFQDTTGIPAEALGQAMQRVADADGEHPLFELEKGRMTEADFLARISTELIDILGHEPEMHGFKEIYFDALEPNPPMIELMRRLQGGGLRMALLTNNVREWEPLWRSMLPVDEIFELVVDSGVRRDAKARPRDLRADAGARPGARRPRRAGAPPSACSWTTSRSNVDAARALGLQAVHFRENDQAIPEIEAAVAPKGSERVHGSWR